MRVLRVFQYVAMILLISTLCVKFVHAEGLPTDLTLDAGFVGRPISLDLFDKTVSIGWAAGDLTGTTGMHVGRSEDGGVSISVDNPTAFASGTQWTIRVASLIVDHPALRITNVNGSIVSYQGMQDHGFVVAAIPSGSMISVIAVSDPDAIALPSEDGSAPLILTDKTVSLNLDSGFVGRAASFDLFDGDITIAWDAKTLLKPTTLTIMSARGGTYAEQESAADGVKISFGDATAVSAQGTFSIRHRALRVPEGNERADVNVFADTTSTRKAAFSGTSIFYAHPAISEGAFAPVYCSGIMKTGMASWYKYKSCLCAASPDVPKGTKLKVTRQDDPTKSVIVTVNDYGPDRTKHPERVIDLDKVAFSKIGNTRGGVLAVVVSLLP